MSSLKNIINILQLFSTTRRTITVEDVMARLGYSRSTAYRHLQILSEAGMLDSASGNGYHLGPAIVELDYIVRHSDPILKEAIPVMKKLATESSGVAMLVRLYRDTVLCIHREPSIVELDMPFERGRPMPLFRGSMSKVILCHFHYRRLRSLFNQYGEEIGAAGLGNDWRSFTRNLRIIREQGFCVTKREIVPNLAGVSGPIFDREDKVVASITVVVDASGFSAQRGEELIHLTTEAAEKITRASVAVEEVSSDFDIAPS